MTPSWIQKSVHTIAHEGGQGAGKALTANLRQAPVRGKDQRLCELELLQTVAEARIGELENQCRALEASQERLTTAFYEHAPVGYITLDRGGYVVEANATAVNLLGYDSGRLRQTHFRFFVHPNDIGAFLSHLQRCQSGDGQKVVSELRLHSRKQGHLPVQLISVPVNNAGQRLCRTVLVDLSERQRSENALAQAKEFAESIVETVREPLLVLDPDLRIISVNRAFSELFGRSARHVRDRPFEVILHLWWSGNRLREVLERVLLKNETLEDFELTVEPPGLGKRILLLNARRLYQKPNLPSLLLVALEDITDRKEAEQQLKQISRELEMRVASRTEDLQRSYQQMEAFCYSIAHDLRAPLRTMVGFSELLSEIYGPQINDAGRDYMNRIRESGKRMDRMILDLLSYGKLNTVHLPMEYIDLDEVFQEVLGRHDKDIQERKALIRKTRPLPTAWAHRVVMEVAFTNLLSNALKFVAADKRPRVAISHEDKGEFIRVCVRDNGIGIEPENVRKIFGVFQRLHPSNTYSGTGIGLALVSKGMERIGGRVGVESQPGTGSCFWIEIPKNKPA